MEIKVENQWQRFGSQGELSLITIELFDYDWIKGARLSVLGISFIIEFGGTSK